MRNILEEIVEAKRPAVEAAKEKLPLSEVKARLTVGTRPVAEKLGNARWSLIAECKLQSPAKGRLTVTHTVDELARVYEANGAAMLSVHTDPHFLGKSEDLARVRKEVSLPLLRKDFVIDPYQVYEARKLGADAVLLIVRILPEEVLQPMIDLAEALGMDALVEAHGAEDLERALATTARFIGINNRNLTTFRTDISETLSLMPQFPSDRIAISESGVLTADDARTLYKAGCRGVLVGEGLVRAPDTAAMVREIAGIAKEAEP